MEFELENFLYVASVEFELEKFLYVVGVEFELKKFLYDVGVYVGDPLTLVLRELLMHLAHSHVYYDVRS